MTAPPLYALIVLLDGYDLRAMGLAVPALGKQWHLAPSALTIAQSASLLGLGLGSAFIAPLGDRLGRRPLLLAGLLILLLTSLGAATATGTGQLARRATIMADAQRASLRYSTVNPGELAP